MNKLFVGLSFLLSCLIIITSLSGLFISTTYSQETVNWTMQAQAQDWVNLVVIVPLILVSSLLAQKSTKWQLIWTGSIIANLYSFILYTFFVHFGPLFLVYIAISGLSFYLALFSLSNFNYIKFAHGYQPNKNSKLAAGLMITLGLLFALLWLADIVPNTLSGTKSTELVSIGLIVNPIHALDLAFFLPALILTGFSLLKNQKPAFALTISFLTAVIIISVNITSIFFFSKLTGQTDTFSLMPVFIILIFLQAYTLASYIKTFKSS